LPHPSTPPRLVATRIGLDGSRVVRPVPTIHLPHIVNHLRSLRSCLVMDPPNSSGLGAYTPLPCRLPRYLPALHNILRHTKQVQRILQSDLQRPGIPSTGIEEQRGTLHQIPQHRNRHRSKGGMPAAREARASNGSGQLHTRAARRYTQKLGNDRGLLVNCLQSSACQRPLPSPTQQRPHCDIANPSHLSLIRDQEKPPLVADVPPTIEQNPTPTPAMGHLTAMDRRIRTETDWGLLSQTVRNPV
jgi:hypothetical protein